MTTAPAVRDTSTRYDDDIKQLAFETYRFRAERRVRETVRLLAGMGYELSDKTIYEWRQAQRWDEVIALDEAERQEALVREYAGKLRTVAPDAVKYLDDVAQGRVAGDPLRVRAAQILATENRHLVVALEREIDRERNRNLYPQNELRDLSAMSDEEFYAFAEQYRR